MGFSTRTAPISITVSIIVAVALFVALSAVPVGVAAALPATQVVDLWREIRASVLTMQGAVRQIVGSITDTAAIIVAMRVIGILLSTLSVIAVRVT